MMKIIQYNEDDPFRMLGTFQRNAHLLNHRKNGLSSHEIAMVVLYRLGATTQKQVQEALSWRSASLSQVMSQLEASGLVERKRSEYDRRVMLIRLTDQGKKKAEKLYEIRKASADELFELFSEEERVLFGNMLERLHQYWLEVCEQEDDE